MTRMKINNISNLLKEKRGNRGIREVSNDIGISSATLSRIENGKLPDLETFSKVCRWLQIDPNEILGCKDMVQGDSREESGTIYAHLRADKTPNPETAQALAQMILAAQSMISEKMRRR